MTDGQVRQATLKALSTIVAAGHQSAETRVQAASVIAQILGCGAVDNSAMLQDGAVEIVHRQDVVVDHVEVSAVVILRHPALDVVGRIDVDAALEHVCADGLLFPPA